MAEHREVQKARQPRPPRLCVYCCIRPAVKMDHVVAKVFFEKLPVDMITVPSCDECDSGNGDGIDRPLHHDEEYMRNVLCMREDISDTHPVARRLLNTQVMRSFENSVPLAKMTLRGSKLVNVRTPAGIRFPEPKASFNVDLDRIRRVTRKIVRGMHYAKERKAMAPSTLIEVVPDLTDGDFDRFLAMFGDPNVWNGLGDRVFMYKAARVSPQSEQSLWLMVFYRAFAVLALTMTPRMLS